MTLKIGIVQQTCGDDREKNIETSLKGIAECAAKGANLVVLQELHCGIYFCQAEDLAQFKMAEPIPSPTSDIFSKAAKKHKIVLVTSLFERRAAGIYHNTAVVFDKDGSMAGKYRKQPPYCGKYLPPAVQKARLQAQFYAF